MDTFIDAMTARARHLGVSEAGRDELWRERAAQDGPVIEQLRAASLVATPSPSRFAAARRADLTESFVVGAGAPSWQLASGERVADRVDRALERIAQISELNAFTEVFADRARLEARALDDRDGQGQPRGPLHGAVIAVKDLMVLRGHRASAGISAFHPRVADQDADVVRRLTAAGAVLVGATNLHALAFGPFSTSSDAGVVGNPLRPGAVSGGSSGGSAAAVASGVVHVAIGTDTAGSIRIPGAACGVVGLKGTFGAAPTDGVYPLAATLDHVGPMTRTVADAAVVWGVMGDESMAVGGPLSLEGVVIGEPSAFSRGYLDEPVRDALDSALMTAVEMGARVQQVDVPGLDLAPALMLCTIGPEALELHLDLLRTRAADLPDDVRLRLEAAMLVSKADYERAQLLRAALRAELDQVMSRVDVLLLPTLPVTIPLVSQIGAMSGCGLPFRSAMSRLTAPFNLTGQPAITLPWGTDRYGGGIGMQIVGARHDERTVLHVAAALEEARPEKPDRRSLGE